MEKSKVYFTSLRTSRKNNLLTKLKGLCIQAGMGEIDFKNKFTAIKIHFGEPGNLAYLRPNFAKVVADLVKELGGKVFLTDCNTLYVGRRKEALEHMDAAYENGYNPFMTGCQIIIGDGLKGADDVEVPVEGGEYIQTAKIGRAVMDADILISMTHFKGHENTGFGGTLKNIGMGCGSRRGKMEMHSCGKPSVKEEKCTSCFACARICAFSAISYRESDKKAQIDHDLCVGCGRCIAVCPFDAIYPPFNESNDILNYKIAEYTKAVVAGRPQFHLSFVMDVSPDCDCHAENDLPIIQDVGIFASFDPVALDMACADACNASPIIKGSYLDEQENLSTDRFSRTPPKTNWKACIDHGVKIKLGNDKYELIKV